MPHPTSAVQKLLWALALAALPAVLVFLLLAVANAQEATQEPTEATAPAATGEASPAATGEPTPDASIKTLVRIEVDPQTEPIPKGTEFEARVMVDNVEHLAAFSFTISYDPKRLQPVTADDAQQTPEGNSVPGTGGPVAKTRGLGDILATSDRDKTSGMICGATEINRDASTITAVCTTTGAPVCLGGLAGASGSGLLGAVYFKSKGGGTTTITLADAGLSLDDFEVCQEEVAGTTGVLPGDCLPFRQEPDPGASEVSCQPDGTVAPVVELPVEVEGQQWVRLQDLGWAMSDYLQVSGTVSRIETRRENAIVELAKGGGSSTIIIIVAVVVVLAVAGGGAAGYVWYRRRRTSAGA